MEAKTDKTIREIAKQNSDTDILSVTTADIVAAEAKYHKTRYRDFTRKKQSMLMFKVIQKISIKKCEKEAFNRFRP